MATAEELKRKLFGANTKQQTTSTTTPREATARRTPIETPTTTIPPITQFAGGDFMPSGFDPQGQSGAFNPAFFNPFNPFGPFGFLPPSEGQLPQGFPGNGGFFFPIPFGFPGGPGPTPPITPTQTDTGQNVPGGPPGFDIRNLLPGLFGTTGSNTEDQAARSLAFLTDIVGQGFGRGFNQIIEPLLGDQLRLLQSGGFVPEDITSFIGGLNNFIPDPQNQPLQQSIVNLIGQLEQGSPELQEVAGNLRELISQQTGFEGQVNPNVESQELARQLSQQNLNFLAEQGFPSQQAFLEQIVPLLGARGDIVSQIQQSLGQGVAPIGTPGIQQPLEDVLRTQLVTGGLTPEFIQSQRELVFDPANRELLGRLNTLGGGQGFLQSGLPAELQREQERDFQNQLLSLGFQGQQRALEGARALGGQQFAQDLARRQLEQSQTGLGLQGLAGLGGEARADEALISNLVLQLNDLLQRQQQIGGQEARAFQQQPFQQQLAANQLLGQTGQQGTANMLNLLNQLTGREQFLGDFVQRNIFGSQAFLNDLLRTFTDPVTAALSGIFQRATARDIGRGDILGNLFSLFGNQR